MHFKNYRKLIVYIAEWLYEFIKEVIINGAFLSTVSPADA